MASFKKPINYLLFLSSYVPLFILIGIRIHEVPEIKTLSVLNFSISLTYTTLIVVSCIFLTLLLIWSISTIRERGSVQKKVEKIRLRNERLASYLVVYVFVFAGLSFTVLEDLIIFFIFFALLFFIEIRSELLYTNPLLAIWGYKLFEVTLDDRVVLVISKGHLEEKLIQKENDGQSYTELELIPMGRTTFIEPNHD
jgi:hypothetical protein